MNSKSLYLLLGFLTSTVFGDRRFDFPSINEIASEYEEDGMLNNSNFIKPTKEEWIQIIEETLYGESLPKYLADRNFTFAADLWSEYVDSTGVTGSFNQTVYNRFSVFGDQVKKTLIAVQPSKFDSLHFISVTAEEQMFSPDPLAANGTYVSSIAVSGATFLEIDDTLLLMQEVLGFGQEENMYMSSDEREYMEMLYILVKTAEGFSISSQQVQGMINIEKDKYHFDVFAFQNMIPISGLQEESLPEDLRELAQIFKMHRVSSPPLVIAEGSTKCDITFDGDYSSESTSFTAVLPGQISNSTLITKGTVMQKAELNGLPMQVRNLIGSNILQFH